ncbi:MAG: hypothetical protein LDL30_13640 [Desulfovibrio sp.]|nr:hypothetical protein [Desulfovibrio sp.]
MAFWAGWRTRTFARDLAQQMAFSGDLAQLGQADSSKKTSNTPEEMTILRRVAFAHRYELGHRTRTCARCPNSMHTLILNIFIQTKQAKASKIDALKGASVIKAKKQ